MLIMEMTVIKGHHVFPHKDARRAHQQEHQCRVNTSMVDYVSTLGGVQIPQESILNIYNWSKLTYMPECADVVCLHGWLEQFVFACVSWPSHAHLS